MDLLTIKDKTAYGQVLNAFQLPVAEKWMTVRELITSRVESEVSRYNRRGADYFRGLVQPEGARSAPLGFKLRRRQVIDSGRQVYIALDAFQKNRFFVLVDGHQAVSLDEPVRIGADTEVSFIKRTPLIGG